MRIVQIIPHSCLAPASGGEVKTAALATALSRVGELHVLSLEDDHRKAGADQPAAQIQLPYGGAAVYHSLVGWSQQNRFPRNLAIQVSGPFRVPLRWRPRTPRERELWRRLAALAPDVVVGDDSRWAPQAAYGPARLRIVHTHNLESVLWAQQAARHPEDPRAARGARRYARLEREVFPLLHQVWAVQEGERQAYIRGGLAPERVVVAPSIMPDGSFLDRVEPGEPGLAAFFGSLWYGPNIEATEYLFGLARRWHEQGAAARLVVAGRGASAALQARAEATPGLDLLGFVPDLGGLLRRAAVVLVPLLSGGGVKIKVLEALAAGKPLLTTPVGADGFDLEDGVHAIIREAGPDFDAMALAMAREPARFADLGRRGQDWARARFSQANLDRAVAGAIQAGLERLG